MDVINKTSGPWQFGQYVCFNLLNEAGNALVESMECICRSKTRLRETEPELTLKPPQGLPLIASEGAVQATKGENQQPYPALTL